MGISSGGGVTPLSLRSNSHEFIHTSITTD